MDDPLPKYLLLVPLRYNDGTPVPEEVILELKEELVLLANGWTMAGTVEGAYRMADGRQQIDHSLQFWIVVNEDRFSELERIVGELGHKLGQESMFLETPGGMVYFVPPRPPESDESPANREEQS